MTEREFKVRYRDLDAVVVTIMWNVWLRSAWDVRQDILTAFDRLAGAAVVAQFGARRSVAGGGPTAAPVTTAP